jgi:23S rRNA pseudouridine1911/1915/1917 synthase
MPDFDPNYPPFEERVYTFVIPGKQVPVRLDVYLTETLANATRSKVQEAIENGSVTVNGIVAKVSRKIQPADVIVCRLMKPPPMELVPENIPLDIPYEDDALLVVNKAAGMVTHPGFGNRYGTLVNALLWHFGERTAIALTDIADDEGMDEEDNEEGNDVDEDMDEDVDDAVQADHAFAIADNFSSSAVRPGIVHRLDKDTSGILVIAKDAVSHAKLAKQFADRTAKRQYYALVWGVVKDDTGVIETQIGRSPRDRKIFAVVAKGGKQAITEYTVIERFASCTLLALRLRTGRTHQIRVHCAQMRHPLISDAQYGGASVVIAGNSTALKHHGDRLLRAIPRQALHAKTLAFTHPTATTTISQPPKVGQMIGQTQGQWMEFDSVLPPDFEAALHEARTFVQR